MKIEKAIEIVKNNSALKFPSKVSHKEYQEALNQVLDVCNSNSSDGVFTGSSKCVEYQNVRAGANKISTLKTSTATYKLPKPVYYVNGYGALDVIADILAQVLDFEVIQENE